MMDTTMVRQSGMAARTTVAEGAAALMHLITSPDISTGQYYNGQKPAKATRRRTMHRPALGCARPV